jgi:uncharacterized cupin superfamily protein
MPKIDISKAQLRTTNVYPEQFKKPVEGRQKAVLGDLAGLTQFGVNRTRLPPGVASSLRHWHEREDEFVYILEGEVMLVEDGGETLLKAGDAAGWKAGVANGHMLVNRSNRDAIYLEIGSRLPNERAHYPDYDLLYTRDEKGLHITHRDGKPY